MKPFQSKWPRNRGILVEPNDALMSIGHKGCQSNSAAMCGMSR